MEYPKISHPYTTLLFMNLNKNNLFLQNLDPQIENDVARNGHKLKTRGGFEF